MVFESGSSLGVLHSLSSSVMILPTFLSELLGSCDESLAFRPIMVGIFLVLHLPSGGLLPKL